MPTILLTDHGKVTGLWGHAIIKGADGRAHPLKLGDIVRRGDVILTTQDGIVELTSDGSAAPIAATAATVPVETPAAVPASRTDIDQVIEKLAQNDADAATAAGLVGGDSGEFLPGLRVDRISEPLTTLRVGNNQETDPNGTLPTAAANPLAAAGANIAPSAVDSSISGPENTTLPVALRGIDSDGNVVSVTLTSVPTGGTLLLADGSTVVSAGQTLTPAQAAGLLFKPAIDFVGQAAITFFVTDNQGATSNGATVSLNVVDTNPPSANQPPVAVNDSATTAEDTPASGNVLGNDRDPEGLALTVTQFSLNGVTYAAGATAVLVGIGSLTLAANGAYTFTPVANYNGPVPVATYTVSDGTASISATLTLSVSPVADPPVAAPDTVTATEDRPVTFDTRRNDSDADGSPLAITAIAGQPIAAGSPVTLPQGTVALNPDGTLTFTPNPNFNGPTVFGYTVSDGTSTSSSQVTINVAPVNDAPVAVNDLASTPINTPLANIKVLANDRDPDGDPVSVSAATVDPARGTVTVNPNGTLSFTPAADVSGPVLISYTVSDGQGGVATATVTVNVGPNAPPAGTDKTVLLDEDGSRAFGATHFGFTDADAGQTFANVRIDQLPRDGLLTLGGAPVASGQVIAVADLPTLVFTPAPNGNGAGYATFMFSVQDSSGAFDATPNQITLDVRGIPDAAVIGGNASGTAVEDSATTASGTLTVSDPDSGEAAFNPQTSVGVPNGHGTFSIDANGAWTYLLNNLDPAVQALGAGQSLPSESFTVTTIDGTSRVVTINITGTNDAPMAQDARLSVTEDAPVVNGNVSATDIDANAALSYSLNGAPPAGLTFNPNGSYSFDASNAAYQSLAAGQPLVLTIPYTVTDDRGATSIANLLITVTGTNDAPVAVAAPASGDEDSTGVAVQLGGNDADGTITSYTIGSLPPNGTLFFNGSPVTAGQSIPATAGSATLSFVPAANFNGSTSFNFSATDNEGATSPPVTAPITVASVGDPAVISGTARGATVEDTVRSASGQLNVFDPDTGEAAFNPRSNVSVVNGHGSFSIDAAGAWTYTLNNADPAVQALGAGQRLPDETFTVTTIDGTSQVVTVTITGTDDAPVISTGSGSVVENTLPAVSGTLSASDIDNPALAFNPGTVSGNFGALVLAPNGAWTYTLDSRAEPLSAGQTAGDTITVTLNDGSTTTVTISITGTNDAAVIGGVATGSVTEDGTATTSGTLTVTDIDNPATFVAATAAGTYGDFTVTAAGAWSYTLRNADANVQALTSAQRPVESFTVTSADGTTSTVTVTVNGANEPPVAIVAPASGNEDSAGIPVLLGGTDIDGSIASFTIGSLPANGTLFFNGSPVTVGLLIPATAAAAALSFVPAANFNGSTSFDFTATDNEGAVSPPVTVPISVAALADAAVIGGVTTGATVEETTLTTGGTLTVTDPDAGEAAFNPLPLVAGAHGTFSINAAGVWTYTLNNADPAVQALGAGQTLPNEIFTVSTIDGTSQVVTVTITGTNDVPVAQGASIAVTEDAPLFTGNISATDVDANAVLSFGLNAAPPAGLTFNPNGSYTFDASNAAYQSLAVGQQQVLTIPYTVTDDRGATSTANLVITITGANDAAVVSAGTGSVTEDSNVIGGNIATSGTLTVTDADAGQATFQAQASTPGVYGSFTLGANGAWTYAAANSNPAIQALGAGQTLTETFQVRSADGTTSSVVVTIKGTNDAPVARGDEGTVTAAQTLIVSTTEGVIQSTSVAAGRDTDVDGDVLSVTRVSAGTGAPTTAVPSGGVTIAGTYGDLLLRNDGSYNYSASRADAVATGTQVNDVFTYQVSDGNGGLATASLTLQVGGTADTLNAAPPTTTALTATLGLNGEYYGYNDFNPGPTSPNRRHADDGLYGNLDRVADVTSIVNGRNAAFAPPGTSGIVGSSLAAAADTADARFTARAIDYGTSPTVSGTLGTNPNVAAGGSTAGLTNDNSQLFKFLNRSGGGDAGTITVGRGTGDNDQIGGGPTSGLGRTSDAAIRITGQAYLAAGLYDIRVFADDGFRLKLDDQTVAVFDNIQSPTTRVYTGVPIEGGLTPLELLYWEQGGNAVLRVEFKLSNSDSPYQVLGSQNLPLFSDANAPVLTDLQDLVAGPTSGSYLVRTGSLLDGGNGDDTLNGSAGRDILIGGLGKDTLNGGAGDDLIRGGAGNDQLTGGAGHDVFRWSLGDAGTAGTPARDVISDFDNTPHGGDVLDLRDLLVGESHAANTVALPASIGLNNALTITPHEGNLANYLHFSAVGGNTVVEISSTGGFSSSYTPAAVDQVITLTGLNLVGSFSNDQQVINDLLKNGKLITD